MFQFYVFLNLIIKKILYISEDIMMQYKLIDSKIKEIYFNAELISEEDEVVESRFLFWNNLNSIAIQNISIQQLKFA